MDKISHHKTQNKPIFTTSIKHPHIKNDKIPDHNTQNNPIFTASVEHPHINHKINTSKYIVKLEQNSTT